MLERLHGVAAGQPSGGLVAENRAALEQRVAPMPYPHVQAQGGPIGSGMVGSANQLVVEARLREQACIGAARA